MPSFRCLRPFGLISLLFMTSGCGGNRIETAPPRGPLFTGKLEGGTFWKYPVGSASNEGGSPEKGSRVEIYEHFVVVTSPNGLSSFHRHNHITDLAIKKD
jgi:hypothetical protein